MGETQRVFIAIDLTAEFRRVLAEIQSALKSGVPADAVRWVQPEGIHLTLKFLGEVPLSRMNDIQTEMEKTTAPFRPFRLETRETGCFPSLLRPRVIWVGMKADSGLMDLQKGLEERLSVLGFAKEQRAFSAHLTLGRVKDGIAGAKLREIGQAVIRARIQSAASMEADGVTLFRSILRPGGAEYSTLHRSHFNG